MQIDVWSDFACPWCALGLARLGSPWRASSTAEASRVVHRSFELDRARAGPSSDGSAEEARGRASTA